MTDHSQDANWVEYVAGLVAPTIRAEFEKAGQPMTWETLWPMLQSLHRQLGVLSPSDEVAASSAARKAWVKAEGLRSDIEARSWLGLSGSEWRTALRLHLIVAVPVPEHVRFPGDTDGTHSGIWYRAIELTEEQRTLIAENTLVNAYEAAARWGMRPERFRKARSERGLTPVSEKPHPLYRLSDVLQLSPKSSAR